MTLARGLRLLICGMLVLTACGGAQHRPSDEGTSASGPSDPYVAGELVVSSNEPFDVETVLPLLALEGYVFTPAAQLGGPSGPARSHTIDVFRVEGDTRTRVDLAETLAVQDRLWQLLRDTPYRVELNEIGQLDRADRSARSRRDRNEARRARTGGPGAGEPIDRQSSSRDADASA